MKKSTLTLLSLLALSAVPNALASVGFINFHQFKWLRCMWAERSYYVNTGATIFVSGDSDSIGPGDTLVHNDWESGNIGMEYGNQSEYYYEVI